MRRDIEAALHERPAELAQPIAKRVTRRSPGLGHGHRDETPLTVPSAAGGVLGVGQPGALDREAEAGQAGRRRPESSLSAGPLPLVQSLLDEPAQAGPDLLGALSAGLGDRKQLGRQHGAVVVGHAEDQDPGRDFNGRDGHDRHERWLSARVATGPVDAREAASVKRFLAELDRLPAPFDRDADPVHVTASAIVVGPEGVLLHRHKRLGLWLQPGGHLDPGEAPLEAAQRETLEETGLLAWPRSAEVAHVDVHGGGLGHVHLDLRFVFEASGPPHPADGESPAVRWFGPDEALALADPGLRGALSTLLASPASLPRLDLLATQNLSCAPTKAWNPNSRSPSAKP